MRILVTGSNGFAGQNLVWNLKEIQKGKNTARPDLVITDIFCIDRESKWEDLEKACEKADFVFHFAGVNRPKNGETFMEGNYGFASRLLEMLQKYCNSCPVMLASSSQASLTGRFSDSEYGRSKLKTEELFLKYGQETGAKVLVYRFPNIFGKWCRPDYNSAVATFCHSIANGLKYTVHDPAVELELLYIDDLIDEMLEALEGREHRCEFQGLNVRPANSGRYCYVPVTHYVALGEIIDMLNTFHAMHATLFMPQIPEGSFAKKLYSTFLSYLPASGAAYELRTNTDGRGSFTELIRTFDSGQVSVNITRPGITRGHHWHNSKWEIFVVVSGHGLIQERQIGINPKTGKAYPVWKYEVTGSQMTAVQILPGFTHSITNLSDTQDLITIMWANETFDKNHPDTFYENVQDMP